MPVGQSTFRCNILAIIKVWRNKNLSDTGDCFCLKLFHRKCQITIYFFDMSTHTKEAICLQQLILFRWKWETKLRETANIIWYFSLSLAINVDKDISFTSNYMREEIVCERKNKRNVSRAAYLPRCGACQPRVRFQNPNERHIPREYTRRRGRFTEKSKYRSLAFLFFSNTQHSTAHKIEKEEKNAERKYYISLRGYSDLLAVFSCNSCTHTTIYGIYLLSIRHVPCPKELNQKIKRKTITSFLL